MEFKDGDKLRYVGAKSHYYTVGSVYELQEKCGDTVWLTDDESNEDANHEWDFWDLEANFERIDEPQFKAGDKLRFVGRSREWYTKDAVYEVASIEEDEGVIWVAIHDNKGLYRGWKVTDIPGSFERIDEPQEQQSQTDRVEPRQADVDILDAWLNHTAYSVVNGFDEQYAQGVKKGILLTLDAYGIEVKGINAK